MRTLVGLTDCISIVIWALEIVLSTSYAILDLINMYFDSSMDIIY